MKRILYIFSIYVLFLACFPCVDEECRDEATHTSSTEEKGSKADACPPFCIYQCCIAHVLCNPVMEITFTQIKYPTIKGPYFKETFLSTTYSSIWQPPKI